MSAWKLKLKRWWALGPVRYLLADIPDQELLPRLLSGAYGIGTASVVFVAVGALGLAADLPIGSPMLAIGTISLLISALWVGGLEELERRAKHDA